MPRPRVPHRRERILDAAESLILIHGFDGVSIAAIAAHGGIGKGAVYLEFAGKHAILDELLRRAMGRVRARVQESVGDDPRLSTAYRAAARAVLSDRLVAAALLDDQGVLGRHAETVSDARYRVRHRAVVEWVRLLQRQGQISADVVPEHLALALSSATIGLLSAARLIGPIGPHDLEGAIDALGAMAATFERG